jgi:hypothetical protein
VKYWEIIVNKIIKAGFSAGWVSALDDYGRTVWIVDAHRGGKRFVVRADEKLTASGRRRRNQRLIDFSRRRLSPSWTSIVARKKS